MIVIAPLFGIAQTVYYLGVAERIMGVKKWSGNIQCKAIKMYLQLVHFYPYTVLLLAHFCIFTYFWGIVIYLYEFQI